MQEVTLSLEPERAGGGLLVPGDSVGLIMSFDPFAIEAEGVIEVDGTLLSGDGSTNTTTHQTLHKILVTNVQLEQVPEVAEREGVDDEEDREVRLVPSGNLLVTFAVDVATAERIVFGAEYGKIWLTNQSVDVPEGPSIIQNRGTIYEDIENLDESILINDDGGDQ